jgi:hypothetical protein
MIHNSPSPPEEINVDELIQNIITKSTTSDLDKLLSPPTSKDLTANELTFSYLFAATNNIYTALEGSSFLSTLREQKGTAYIHTLGTFLLNKPNIKGMINKFLLDQTTQEEVTKDLVQNELVTQIFQLKEKLKYDVSSRGADRGYLLKAIEMLGKSVGAFSERLTIEQVDPGQALDKLIECAKRETSQGSYTIIDEEIVDDNGE